MAQGSTLFYYIFAVCILRQSRRRRLAMYRDIEVKKKNARMK